MRTEVMERRRLKLSLMESTMDWIEGSKNVETCALCARMSWRKFINRVVWVYPVNINFPALIPQ